MEAEPPRKGSISRTQDPNNGYPMPPSTSSSASRHTTRSPGASRFLSRNTPSLPDLRESRYPPMLTPLGFESMLRTSTETGDIGLFSIKPSRVPQSPNTPRRSSNDRAPRRNSGNTIERPPRRASGKNREQALQRLPSQPFQPYGVPGVDDRKRLPSYVRDASSEVISMYETASQKSANREMDYSDARAYSMTQTAFYSSNTLSKNRSYTSLTDASGPVQRPRSPFAYPSRLKRPGFRPSSPALTDEGAVDYSRRAEIDRTPYKGGGHHTSSPSSLYAQRRRPHGMALRPDGHRSTHSLLSQSSPPRPRTPGLRQSSAPELPRRAPHTPRNISPARSNMSFSSTLSLRPAALPHSTATTPGKIASSPLYYDYTEDFDVDEYIRTGPLDHFSINGTIPEDHPLTQNISLIDAPELDELQASSIAFGVRSSSLPDPRQLRWIQNQPQQSSQDPEGKATSSEKPAPSQSTATTESATVPIATEGPALDDESPNRRSVRVIGACLPDNIDEADGLVHDRSQGNLDLKAATEGVTRRKSFQRAAEQGGKENLAVNQKSRPYRSADSEPELYRRDLGSLVNRTAVVNRSDPTAGLSDPLQDVSGQASTKYPSFGKEFVKPEPGFNKRFGVNDISAVTESKRTSAFSSLDGGLDELALLVSVQEKSSQMFSADDSLPYQRRQRRVRTDIEKLDSIACDDLSPGARIPSTSDLYSRINLESMTNVSARNLMNSLQQSSQQQPIPEIANFNETVFPNFSHQVPRKLLSRTEAPLLAPKPISPARQLRLKNSVPELMKTLPAAPANLSIQAVSPLKDLLYPETELLRHFSPLIPEESNPPIPEADSALTPIQNFPTNRWKGKGKAVEPVELDSRPIPLEEIPAHRDEDHNESPPKLRLKIRSSVLRPMNLTGDDYPWLDPSSNPAPPALLQEIQKPESPPQPPKFKLRVTRASESIDDGTVRIKRNSADPNSSEELYFPSSKDLFTPPYGFDDIFRKVSQQLHAHQGSKSEDHLYEEAFDESSALTSKAIPSAQLANSDSQTPHLPATKIDPFHQSSPFEVHSLSKGGSPQSQDQKKPLRKRWSNLRARKTVPYLRRNASQSCDDLVWRERPAGGTNTLQAAKSTANLHEAYETTGSLRRTEHKFHAHRLRAKVSQWFKDARSAITARMKVRSSSGRHQLKDNSGSSHG